MSPAYIIDALRTPRGRGKAGRGGATGAMLIGTALDELERRNLNTALITLCIAGGQGVALMLERV